MMRPMRLTAQQVAQYQRDGYVCPVQVMPAAEALGHREFSLTKLYRSA